MKPFKYIIYGLVIASAVQLYSCKKLLEPEEFTQTVPDNLFNTLQGVESVLYGAYAKSAEMQGSNVAANHLVIEASLADIVYSINASANLVRNYDLDGGRIDETLWSLPYQSIRNTNILLENVESANINDDSKTLITAEAKFIRAICYFRLYNRFGPVPLRTSTTQELALAKATEQEMTDFIESELLAAIPGLPSPGQEKAYGRAHKGAAWGHLMRLYLYTKQWQKTIDAAQEIIDLNYYELFPDYFTLFFVANERNRELIWVRPAKADVDRTAALTMAAFAYPPNFNNDPRTGLTFVGANFGGSNVFVYDAFYDSFDPNDRRRYSIIDSYIANNGNTIDLSLTPNSRRPFKFWPDSDIIGSAYGNDVPEIRYADVLLSKAEALNELNGPTQEAIDLINEVRDRSDVAGVDLADFASKEALRDHILDERGWEFYLEGHRREDLVRHGKLIERAQQRGLPAQDFHVRLPIPSFALDANPNLEQNPGYN